jgi:hypothetical protein
MLRAELAETLTENSEFVRLLNLIMNLIYPGTTYHEDNKTGQIKKVSIFQFIDEIRSKLANQMEQTQTSYFHYVYEIHDLLQKFIPLIPLKNENLLRIDLLNTQSVSMRDFLKDRLVRHDLTEKVLTKTERQLTEFGIVASSVYGYFQGIARSAAGHSMLDSEFTIRFDLPDADDINLSTLAIIMEFLEVFFNFALRGNQDLVILNYETGSPAFNVAVKVKSDDIKAQVRFDVNEMFNSLLTSIKGSETNVAIKEAKKLHKLLGASQKAEIKELKKIHSEIGDDDFYKTEILKIYEKYKTMRNMGLSVVAGKLAKSEPRLLKSGIAGLLSES